MICNKATLNAVAEKVCASARTVLGNKLEKVVLFGSYARGDHHDNSDIDIMILANILPTDADKVRMKIRRLMNYIELEYDIIVNLSMVCSKTFHEYSTVSPLYANIQKEGVVLYA